MSIDPLRAYLLRDSIMRQLSDEEVAGVSAAESAENLADGAEYIDLERLDQGVRLAMGAAPPMGRILPRSAVHQATWSKILMQLHQPPAADSGSDEDLVTPRNT